MQVHVSTSVVPIENGRSPLRYCIASETDEMISFVVHERFIINSSVTVKETGRTNGDYVEVYALGDESEKPFWIKIDHLYTID